jgi:8-oxo-dGTP pyrophosphatase MutT (NUDIX family)
MFMLVQRKDSMSYVEFVRGKYQAHDKEYVTRLVESMTADEQERLRTKPFTDLWQSVWGPTTPRKCLATEFAIASAAFSELIGGKHGHTLAGIMDGDLPNLRERQWGFPKGRRNIREAEVVCAMREFMEETGINSLAVHRFPFSYCEEFLGSNGVTYRHKYYLARLVDPRGLPESGSTTESQAREIGCARWMTYDEALDKLAASEARQGVLHQALAEVRQLLGSGAKA